jgi:PIN domain nuclease of toxin-antitoxin system
VSRRILLDTHIALWAVTGSGRLSATARQLILDAHEVHVSAASVWEIAIKHALGRGDMPVSSEQALQAFRDSGYALLAIKPEHAVRVADLPAIHADPFDRLLIAQAVTEPLRLLTADTALLRYGEMIVRV